MSDRMGFFMLVRGGQNRGKFGRWIVELEIGDQNLGDALLSEGHAVPYGKP